MTEGNYPDLTEFMVVVNDKKTGTHRYYYESTQAAAEMKLAQVLKELQERFQIAIYQRKAQ